MSICLTIGHGKTTSGAYDPGAVSGDFHEHRIAKEIGKYAADYYNAHYAEQCDIINYNSDTFLSERIRLLNAGKYDFAAEIHLNAGGGTGPEVYYSVTGDNRAATIVSAEIASAFSLRNRGAKTKKTASGADYFAIIRQTTMPALLVECLFIDTPSDLELVKTASGQKKMGETIAKAIAKVRGVKKKEIVAPEVLEKEDVLYRVQTGAFREKGNADQMVKKLKAEGFDAFVFKGK